MMVLTSLRTTIAFVVPFLACGTFAQTCDDPQGVQWAAWLNPGGPAYGNPGYPEFDPTIFKKKQPLTSGVTATTRLIGDGTDFAPYDSTTAINGSYFVISHRGYIRAPRSGNYYFTIDDVDDVVEFWVGPKAYKGWKRSNEKTGSASGDSQVPPPYVFHLNKNTYHPFRITYVNADGLYNLRTSILTPKGYNILGDNTPFNPFIVQYGCDPDSGAPAFLPWGSEK